MKYILGLLVLVTSASSFGLSAFQLPQMNHATPGTMYDSAARKGSVFLIEAYFDGCHYCNENAPNVDDMAQSFANEPRVQVLDIGIDRMDSQYKNWISKHKPNHPVLKDDKRQVIRQLGTQGYPSTYVVDCRGKVLYSGSGVWDMSSEAQMKDKISNALKDTCSK